jgi:hypothetical protein
MTISSHQIQASDKGVHAFFMYNELEEMPLELQPQSKEYDIWICVVNRTNSLVRFSTGFNDYIKKGDTELWISINDCMNIIGLRSVFPADELRVVELRHGEATLFKFRHRLLYDRDEIEGVPVKLFVTARIGDRYNCWHGSLKGNIHKATSEFRKQMIKKYDLIDKRAYANE